MPFQIVRDDITRMKTDAIVNAANESLLGGGGVDGAIHKAAGPSLLEECRKLGGCPTGQAKITGAGNLPSRFVIHTVGPIWIDGNHNERELLTSSYKNSLELARKHNLKSIAFPLISSGIYGYPKEEALQVAVETIKTFLKTHDLNVYLVIFDSGSFRISKELYSDIQSYIDDHYVEIHTDHSRRRMPAPRGKLYKKRAAERMSEYGSIGAHRPKPVEITEVFSAPTLDDALKNIEESFSEMLLRKIDESGMSDADCYRKANIDRRLFSKIRSNQEYKPKKPTVLAFAIALELSLEETKEMLEKAGYALSHSSRFDIIVEYFIRNRNYDIFEINEALFAFGQKSLGV